MFGEPHPVSTQDECKQLYQRWNSSLLSVDHTVSNAAAKSLPNRQQSACEDRICCSWIASRLQWACRSGDRTARIWDVSLRNGSSIELHHPLEKEKDVTMLDWNPEGSLLATGSYDGLARIWTKDGDAQTGLRLATCV